MKIHPVNRAKGGNRFCGPAVVSIVTGMTTDEAARLFRATTKRRSIKGTTTYGMVRVLGLCGIAMGKGQLYVGNARPTLAGWLRDNKEKRTTGRVWLIVAGNHWQIVTGRRYCCGRVGEVVSVTHERVKRRARVEEVYELTGEPRIPRQAAKPALNEHQRARLNTEATARRKAKALAAEVGVDLERENDYIWVTCERLEVAGTDPHEGDHIAYDWADALNRVQEYAAFLTQQAA